ncbi:hypothetical protein [Amycolatopsis xylanica]|nr:hypothetical protein [Amycolatopsis xylanica]
MAVLAGCSPAVDAPPPPAPPPSKSTYVYVSPSQIWHRKVNELCGPAAARIAKAATLPDRLDALVAWIVDVERVEIPARVDYAPEFVAHLRAFKESAQLHSLMLRADDITIYGGNGKSLDQTVEESLVPLREEITKYARELDMPACQSLI